MDIKTEKKNLLAMLSKQSMYKDNEMSQKTEALIKKRLKEINEIETRASWMKN